jgi:hypothetical protein
MFSSPGQTWTGSGKHGYHGLRQGVPMARDKIRIGCGAGFADDRIPPGVDIVEHGELDYLAME